VRRFFVRLLLILAVPYAIAIIAQPPLWLMMILTIGAASWCVGFLRATFRLRTLDTLAGAD
jgi:hypothetical protein